MHSPFVFDFIRHVLNDKKNYGAPVEIEKLRERLKHNNALLQIEDFGAGSRIQTSKQKKVSEIARTALKNKKYSQLLYRLVKHYQPRTIIELGTSLGVTTSYLAKAAPTAKLITIEGSSAIHKIAAHNFKGLELTNIEAFQGNFDTVLPQILNAFDKVDLAYIDGNHRLEPTLRYFQQFLSKSHNETILVFDDIHWSREMEEAWETIKQHPSVQCTVDIFFLGFVFLRKEFKEKQHFSVRF